MDPKSLLKDKVVLVVDDEVDVTDTVEEVLDMCLVAKPMTTIPRVSF